MPRAFGSEDRAGDWTGRRPDGLEIGPRLWLTWLQGAPHPMRVNDVNPAEDKARGYRAASNPDQIKPY